MTPRTLSWALPKPRIMMHYLLRHRGHLGKWMPLMDDPHDTFGYSPSKGQVISNPEMVIFTWRTI
jgi:hypothetical protein